MPIQPIQLDGRPLLRAYRDRRYEGAVQHFTILARWPEREGGSVEELDVDAKDRFHARRIGNAALRRDYQPGGRIIDVLGPRTGLYL